LIKLFLRKIEENKYKNRGFILEGYPRINEICSKIFLTNQGDKEVRNLKTFPNYFFIIEQSKLN